MNEIYIKNKEEVFFYPNVTANLSSGGKDFLILLSWNVRPGASKIISLSNVALDILKYLLKKKERARERERERELWMCLQVFMQGVQFSFK